MTSPKIWTAIGLMSGTSMDGVDAALIRTDGVGHVEHLAHVLLPYNDAFRARLRSVMGEVGPIEEVADELSVLHAEAVQALLKKADVAANQVDVVGFHGQTIMHAPWQRRTVQIGDGGKLARLTGIDVVNDMRRADVEAGGQGAPLVPYYHAALAHNLPKPLAILNIGGVANVTYIDADNIIAFDTGPGNALMDDWMLRHTGHPVDIDGALAMQGHVDEARLQQLLAEPYFKRLWPKSLDRDHFSADLLEGLTPANGVATLAAFTTAAVAAGLAQLPARPQRLLVCGGGRHNKVLMAGLARYCGMPIEPVEAVGWNGDVLEAEAFAFLAVRSRLGLPLSLPTTTGVPQPLTGGVFHQKD